MEAHRNVDASISPAAQTLRLRRVGATMGALARHVGQVRAARRALAHPVAPELQKARPSNASRGEWAMTTTTFRDAMAGFSDVLYARAMEHMADKRKHLLDAGSMRANARATMSFQVKLERGGLANVAVKRYCAGFTLRCTAWVELPDSLAWMSGYIHSSDGGGADFERLRSAERVPFELKTSMWRSTELALHLRTTPALPEGTEVTVHMEIDY